MKSQAKSHKNSGVGKHGVEQPRRAAAWMALACVGFATMGVFVKRLSPEVPEFELVLFRSLINFAVVLVIMVARGDPFFPKGKQLLVFRGVAGFGGMSCLFYCLGHLPLPLATLLNWSSPIFVILFSALILGERLRPNSVLWISAALLSVVLILLPGLNEGFRTSWLAGVGVGLLGAAFAGSAYVAVKAAAARVGIYAIVLYLTGVSSLLSAPVAWVQGLSPLSPRQSAEVLALGLLATLGQIAMTEAYRHARASLVSPMSLLNAGMAALLGWWLFDEHLAALQWAGMLLLAVAILMLQRDA
jgi:drug/metabolite transporter (DMT)-like permease